MRKLRKSGRNSIRQSLIILATIAVLPTATGALADTLAENIGQTPGYQVAPPAAKPTFHKTRSSRIEYLEKVLTRLRLRIHRLEAEGLEHRASTLHYRLAKLESELARLRQA